MRALIILRCGTGSIHKSWIARSRQFFDIAFAYYDASDFSVDHPHYAAFCPGTKLTGIKDFLVDRPEIIDRYDYFWLLEDDLFVPFETIQGTFDFLDTIRPALCAPALSPQSYYTHGVTIQNDALFVRGTDFVECMAPIMSRDFLRNTLENFSAYPLYGIERFWQHLLWEMREVAYMLDAFPIVHTRPVGGGLLYGLEATMGIDRFKDDLAAGEKYGRPFNRYVNVLFGIRNDGVAALVVGQELRELTRSGASRFLQVDGSNRRTLELIIEHTGFTNPFFTTCLTFASVRRLLRLPDVSEKSSNLMVRDWAFGSSQNGVYSGFVQLKTNGRIAGYVNDNEYEWKVDGEDLLFISRAGHVTTRFAQWSVHEGRIRLEGTYSDSESARHYLQEI